jgi:hypothetical protein
VVGTRHTITERVVEMEQESWIVDSHEYIVPRLGELLARRTRASTTEPADDVVLLDPRTVEAMLSFTGPAPTAYSAARREDRN